MMAGQNPLKGDFGNGKLWRKGLLIRRTNIGLVANVPDGQTGLRINLKALLTWIKWGWVRNLTHYNHTRTWEFFEDFVTILSNDGEAVGTSWMRCSRKGAKIGNRIYRRSCLCTCVGQKKHRVSKTQGEYNDDALDQ